MTQLITESPRAVPSTALSEQLQTAWNLVLWNLDHARAKTHDAARIAAISESDPDIVVLTETHDRIRPEGEGWSPVHSKPRPGCEQGERWVSLWVRPDVAVTAIIATIDPQTKIQSAPARAEDLGQHVSVDSFAKRRLLTTRQPAVSIAPYRNSHHREGAGWSGMMCGWLMTSRCGRWGSG